ncbi:MAG: C40 family peptidase [Armatimonadota bacterium]
MYGIITKNVLNMHPEPSTDLKLSTQGIIGQTVEIIREEGEWLYVKTWDSYNAWCLKRWVTFDTPAQEDQISIGALITDALSGPSDEADVITKLVITSIVDYVRSSERFAEVILPDGMTAWVRQDALGIDNMHASEYSPDEVRTNIIQTASRFIGTPYLWGGSTPFGIDCSGFTQLVYRLNGFNLPRDSGLQAVDPQSQTVDLHDIIAGDMLFFAGGEDRSAVTHVGIYCGGDAFIHSAGRGTGVSFGWLLDEYYAKMLAGIRRYIV